MVVQDKVIPFEKTSVITSSVSQVSKLVRNNVLGLRDFLWKGALPFRGAAAAAGLTKVHKAVWLVAVAMVTAFVWSYWSSIADLWNIWQRSDEYSSGLLVPFLAAYVLWSRREQLKNVLIKPSLLGLIALLFAEVLRFFGMFYMFGSAQRLSVVVGIAGLVLLLFGWQFFKKIAPILLFLCLMLPWPNRVQAVVTLPLQRWATSSAVFCLEMIGYDVAQEGNIIHIGQANVAVAEACNGLRMVPAFLVISALVALLIRRRWWEKLVVLASSLPIALLCNTIRLAITAMAFTILQGNYWEKIFHDFGGYAMMPMALAAVVAELGLLRWLMVLPEKREPIIMTR
jgi:exosortase